MSSGSSVISKICNSDSVSGVGVLVLYWFSVEGGKLRELIKNERCGGGRVGIPILSDI